MSLEDFLHAFFNINSLSKKTYSNINWHRLMSDAGIIRNRLKINAAIENAKTILTLQKKYGSFQAWLEEHGHNTKAEWVKIFKKTFLFTGGEIVNEFLMSIGFLPGAHTEQCPVYKKALATKPRWARKIKLFEDTP